MAFSRQHSPLIKALVSSFALMGFAFFIPFDMPLKVMAFVAIIGTAALFSSELPSWSDVGKITGNIGNRLHFSLFMVLGIITGLSAVALYRWHLDINLFPRTLLPFGLVAALIGSTEELVYRGFIQGQVNNINKWFPAVFGAFSHTAYKCCLFLSPAIVHKPDILFLAECTFAAGILLGLIRQFSGSVWPAVAAHAIFDILVYGENLNPPFWVW
jgi:membrane protease YdiL (CAAX protease family)